MCNFQIQYENTTYWSRSIFWIFFKTKHSLHRHKPYPSHIQQIRTILIVKVQQHTSLLSAAKICQDKSVISYGHLQWKLKLESQTYSILHTNDFDTFPLCVTFWLCFSLATRILCFAGIFLLKLYPKRGVLWPQISNTVPEAVNLRRNNKKLALFISAQDVVRSHWLKTHKPGEES